MIMLTKNVIIFLKDNVIFPVLCQIIKREMSEMKKYVYLLMSTLLLVGVISMSGYMINGSDTGVEVTVLAKHSVDNTITANGKLQYRSGKQVRSKNAGVMEAFKVKSGDNVKQGDVLYSFYKIDDAYTALISQYTGAGSIEALIGTASKYTSASDLIAELKKYCPVETVRSEYDGRVSSIKYKPDEPFEKNAVIMQISEQHTLEVPVNISENYIGSISRGQKAEVSFNALPEKTFSGTVTKLADEASVTSGLTGKETTVEVTVTLDSSDDELRVGYSAVCTIRLSTDEDVLVLPYDLIRSDEGGDYVFVAEKNKARKRYIKTDKEYKDGIRATEGVSQGDAVINDSEGLYDGQKITIIKRTVQTND